jgi:hypothetical protein
MGDYISAFTHYVGDEQHGGCTRDCGAVSFVLGSPNSIFLLHRQTLLQGPLERLGRSQFHQPVEA